MNRNIIIQLKSYGMLLSILFCVLSGYGQEQLANASSSRELDQQHNLSVERGDDNK